MAARSLEVFVYGCDNHQAHAKVDPIPWVEAGGRITGVLCIHNPGAPGIYQAQAANTDIVIQSSYDCRYVVEWYDSDGERHENHQTEPEIFNTVSLQYGFNVLAVPEAQAFSPDPNYLWIPFWFDLPSYIVQSTTPPLDPKKQTATKDQFFGYIRHKLMVKTSIPGMGITTDWNVRDLLVLKARPLQNLAIPPTLVPVDKLKNISMQVAPDCSAYMEADLAGLVTRIELLDPSASSQNISDATLKLEARCETVRFRFRVPGRSSSIGNHTVHYFKSHHGAGYLNMATREMVTMKEKIMEVKLRGLNLLPGTTQNRCFFLGALPSLLEYHSMAFHHGLHERRIQYEIDAHLDKPGVMNDIDVSVPIEVYPRLASRSTTLAALNPTVYAPNSIPATYSAMYKRQFVLRVLRAEGLPKMDGRFSKSDPYCTVLLNDTHFRNTLVQKNTLTPEWNETFVFNFYEHDFFRDMSLVLECYDDDPGGHDDLMGNVSTVLKYETANMPQPQAKALEITRLGKKTRRLEKMGLVHIDYQWR